MNSEHIRMNRIGFAGNGWGAVAALQGLLKNFSEVHVLSTDTDVLKLVSPEFHSSKLEEMPETIIFSGYTRIISSEFLQDHQCINIHYSLLPKYRGLHSTVWAILNEEEKLGYTVHIIDNEIDHGDIIYQKSFDNDGATSAPDYIRKFNADVEKVIGLVISDHLNAITIPSPQDHSLATWVGKRNLHDCRIDFHRDANYILNLFRCLKDPYPLPHILVNEKIIEVGMISVHEHNCETHIGRVLNVNDRGIYVKCADAYLILSELTVYGEPFDHNNIRLGTKLND